MAGVRMAEERGDQQRLLHHETLHWGSGVWSEKIAGVEIYSLNEGGTGSNLGRDIVFDNPNKMNRSGAQLRLFSREIDGGEPVAVIAVNRGIDLCTRKTINQD